ncbi:YidB family protein [Serratia marcescens]|uniref:YidB family protein n=1 Tax=Serratia marcescens TaxID=615 RepID=UPI001EFF2A85|nr:YidB family protein [Serratia marcescens]
MGLFDSVLGNILGGGANGKGIDYIAIMQWVEQQGGLQAILDKFRQGQFGDIVGSWLGNGENQPITGDHVQQALGSDAINQLAEKLGVDPAQASSTIAQFLPTVVDAASPNGEVQQDSNELGDMVGKLFK